MRRRGILFKSFRSVKKSDNEVVTAISTLNENLKLIMELLADLRVNTSEDPKRAATEERK